MTVKRLTRMAVLTTVALVIFTVEAQIPPLVPVPGVKLGLANIVTLYALFSGEFKARDVFLILLGRILLGAALSGRIMSLIYSASGGLLCFAVSVMLRRILSDKQVWVCGVIGAVFHNIGQIAAAIAVTGTPLIVVYLPQLIAAGVVTGLFTGLITQLVIAGMKGITRL